ncbi:hypothetical protein ACPUER_06565 [Burkholderia sp. DN3021]|uniref:hypothetical protein n=1 Tax=Burkholderia sp. DN3021 TaxID=3410137 RepID=UPI003C7CA620
MAILDKLSVPFRTNDGPWRSTTPIGIATRNRGIHHDAGYSSGSAYVMMQRMKIRNATTHLHHHHGRPVLRRGSFRI